jgi:peptidoglycan hydrolase-like protein with peptidoglycan-binding domain
MKQIAVSRLGWGAIALGQLPIIAITPCALAAQVQQPAAQTTAPSAQPSAQLIAIALTSRSLQIGDRGSDVRALQRYLSRNGLYPFVIDGEYGQDTADAVTTFQRIRDLPATGVADENTLAAMEFEFLPAEPPPAVAAAPARGSRPPAALLSGGLSPNSTGSDVIALQQRLNNLGIPVFVDGVYGFETQQAVRTYQRVEGLDVTGNADSETLESLGFSVPRYPYIAAVIAEESELANVQRYFPDAYIDRDRRGRFINIGNFGERFPAEARVDAATARGFSTRVLYR